MSEVLTVKEGKGSCIFQGATRVCLYPAPSSIAQGVTAQSASCLGLFPTIVGVGSCIMADLVFLAKYCKKERGNFLFFFKQRKTKNPTEHVTFLKPLISV